VHGIECLTNIGTNFRQYTNKCTKLFLSYFYYNITQNTDTCFDPQGTIIMESNQSNTT